MADSPVEIPNRPAFKASEVCEIAQIPSYVLRSWEKEFPGLGVATKPGGPRIFRRSDVEQILRIKHLVFAEGLTLSGARRKLEGEPPPEDEGLPELPVPDEIRTRVANVKRELRSLLEMLSDGERPASASVAGAQGATSPAPAPAGPVPPAAGRSPELGNPSEPAPTWPPSPPSRAEATGGDEASREVLPLLEGVPDTPESSKRRRTRRAGRNERDPEATGVK